MDVVTYFNRKCFNPLIALKGSTNISYRLTMSSYTFIVKTSMLGAKIFLNLEFYRYRF